MCDYFIFRIFPRKNASLHNHPTPIPERWWPSAVSHATDMWSNTSPFTGSQTWELWIKPFFVLPYFNVSIVEYFSAWRPILGARSGEVELVCLCHDEDSYSFPKNVDTTSGSSLTKIMPYIEKFGYKFIWFCNILSILVIDFDWCQRTLRDEISVM